MLSNEITIWIILHHHPTIVKVFKVVITPKFKMVNFTNNLIEMKIIVISTIKIITILKILIILTVNILHKKYRNLPYTIRPKIILIKKIFNHTNKILIIKSAWKAIIAFKKKKWANEILRIMMM